MTTRRLAALRVTLAIAHVLLGLMLLLPLAAIVGFGSLQALAKLPFGFLLAGIVCMCSKSTARSPGRSCWSPTTDERCWKTWPCTRNSSGKVTAASTCENP